MRLAIALALVHVAWPALALPVSPHQLSAYTPYWQSPPHHHGYPYPSAVNCPPPQICNESPNEPQGQGGSPAELAELPSIKSVKRTKNTMIYKTGWTMGGMPFSVLYMKPKPQISVRSPIAEPLRSLPQIYDGESPQRDQPPVDSQHPAFGPNPRVQPLNSPTRRQYSIIPQLFVSYGWGPAGK